MIPRAVRRTARAYAKLAHDSERASDYVRATMQQQPTPTPRRVGTVSTTGWRVAIALGVVQACGMGLLGVYGMFVVPLAEEFDASMATVGAGMSIFLVMFALVGPAVGWAADKGAVRLLMLVGVVAMAFGLWLFAAVTGPAPTRHLD
jgi:hypothetical protein